MKPVYRGHEIYEHLIPHFLGHSFEDINCWVKGERGMRQGKERTALWRIMLDAETVTNNNLRFDTKLSLGEDTKFINEYMLYETSIGFLDETLYYLTVRESGANLSSINNAEKRLEDKTKLIAARMEIDSLAANLHNVDTHKYWEGTMVFSAVEMAKRMAQNKGKTTRENYKKFKNFVSNEQVKKAIKEFHPAWGVKSVPFRMLKFGLGFLLFGVFRILPSNINVK